MDFVDIMDIVDLVDVVEVKSTEAAAHPEAAGFLPLGSVYGGGVLVVFPAEPRSCGVGSRSQPLEPFPKGQQWPRLVQQGPFWPQVLCGDVARKTFCF